jgi:tetratricopeptide (TPR) repeat protein
LAIKIDPDYYVAHTAKGDVLAAAGRYREAIDSYRRALMLAPSSIQPGLVAAYNFAGEPEQAIAYADEAMRLGPRDPGLPILYWLKAIAFNMLQDDEEALAWIGRAEAAALGVPRIVLVRSALLALAGQEADARATMQRYLASDNAPIRTITQWKAQWQGVTFSPRYLMWLQKYQEALPKAGLPE